MKKLILILALLMSVPAQAANTTTATALKEYGKSWTMSFDATGVQCVELNDLSANDTYPYVYVAVDITSGTATYDVEAATADSANETGESSDLPSASDLTADEHFSGTIGMPYLCVRMDACSACAVTATIFATTGGRK